jgi:hypothetical protein
MLRWAGWVVAWSALVLRRRANPLLALGIGWMGILSSFASSWIVRELEGPMRPSDVRDRSLSAT